MAVLESFSSSFLRQLQSCNLVGDSCRPIIQQYHGLLEQLKRSRKDADKLASENSDLQHEKSRLQKELSNNRSIGATSTHQQAKIEELEGQVKQLQEDLRGTYKSIRDQDQAFINLHNEATALRKKLEQRVQEVETLQEEIVRLSQISNERQQQIHVLESDCVNLKADLNASEEKRLLLVKEVESWKLMADTSEIPKLRADNDSLLQRLMEMSAREADTINEMTELNRAKDTKIKVLEEELRDLKSGHSAQMSDGLRAIVTTETPLATDVLPSAAAKTVDVHEGECNIAIFDPVGSYIATGGADKRVKLWDAKSLEMTSCYAGPNGGIVRLCFSSAGDRLLAGCNDSTCYVMVTNQNRMWLSLTGHTGKVWGCAFESNSKIVVTGAHDRTLRWWDLNLGGRCQKTMLCGGSCNDLVVLPGTDIACSAHMNSQIRFWDPRTYKSIETLDRVFEDAQVTSLCVASDNTSLLASSRDGVLKLLDLRTYDTVKTFQAKEMVASINHFKACMSPDGKFIAAGSSGRLNSANQTVCVWGQDGRVMRTLKNAHTGPITSCSWSPEGSPLVSVAHDGRMVVWG